MPLGGTSLDLARLIAKKETAERRTQRKEEEKDALGMKGLMEKFGLVNEENLICSDVLHRRWDTVIEHPLYGDFIDVHFVVFFFEHRSFSLTA